MFECENISYGRVSYMVGIVNIKFVVNCFG